MTADDVETGSKHNTAPQPPARAIWLPVGPALSWVAFGVAEDLWSERFYFGASVWPFLTPAEVAEWLRDMAQYGAAEPTSIPPYAIDLEPAIYRRAEALSPTRIADDSSVRTAAAQARQKLVDGLANATEQYRQIGSAAEGLRLALAKEEIKAFGWRGEWPSADEPRSIDRARAQIPPTVFAAPVTLTHRGLLPFIQGDLIEDGWTTLWHSIRIHADDLLKLRPAPEGSQLAGQYEPTQVAQSEQRSLSRTGRHRHKMFVPFVREMIRVADIDSLTDRRDERDPQEAVRAQMKAWLESNPDEDKPSDTTIRAWIAELWPTSAGPAGQPKKP
jgi:hypothetical protein